MCSLPRLSFLLNFCFSHSFLPTTLFTSPVLIFSLPFFVSFFPSFLLPPLLAFFSFGILSFSCLFTPYSFPFLYFSLALNIISPYLLLFNYSPIQYSINYSINYHYPPFSLSPFLPFISYTPNPNYSPPFIPPLLVISPVSCLFSFSLIIIPAIQLAEKRGASPVSAWRREKSN